MMGDIVNLKDFKKIPVKTFKVYYDYAEYYNPTDLLADFIDGLESDPCGNCSFDQNSGDYNVYLPELDNEGNDVYVNVRYDGIHFGISEEHPRGREISDLFVKHLIEKKVPWELCEEGVVLDREIDYDSYDDETKLQ